MKIAVLKKGRFEVVKCQGMVRYLPTATFRPCSKEANYRVGRKLLCGTHTNRAARLAALDVRNADG
mgnify:CR=1 FL=1